ncbi:Uncharacterised protein [Mycobacteroides abscessus subsp. massiliense]|nr:Uncharacterised protein [Mycobacteroides abscessus]CPX99420.1 Uncharacterised protein [Mycobacteroides abscessus]CQA11286.1 Uncharacterised protein [Mycobacteroides abscessus]SKM95797.1 Uncharacterised protein [Mycobacteroides abscessus subsp. massiliense]
MIGEHKPIPLSRDTYQGHPECRRFGQVADRRAFCSTQPLELFVLIGAVPFGAQVDIAPTHRRFCWNELYRLFELTAESRRQMRMAGGDSLDRTVKPLWFQRAIDGDVELHHVKVALGPVPSTAMENEALLQCGQWQHICDRVLLLQLVELALAQLGRCDVRRRQSATARVHVRADAGQSVEPQLTQTADLIPIECRRGPGPIGLQLRAVVGLDRSCVQRHRVGQGHRYRGGHPDSRHAVDRYPPQIIGHPGGSARHPPEVVEPHRRVGCREICSWVQVPKQTEGQALGLASKLFLGILESRAQCLVSGHDIGPAHPTPGQRHRILGGEPPDSPRQVDSCRNLLMPAVALDIDADRGVGGRELGQRQPKCDQQNVLRTRMECRGYRAEQHPGGLDIQRYRELPRSLVGVRVGSYRRKDRRCRRDLPPRPRMLDNLRIVGERGQQLRPPPERGARRRQHHGLAITMLRPAKVDVLQENSPGHAIYRQVMDDHHQLRGRRHPQRTEHHPGRRIQPRPRRHHGTVREILRRVQTCGGID